ncbi:hemerythrin domain-containing protein [Rhodoferax aquaticus]|uniref:Hemerythrin n=1 Tax=Rhodoferax aquaticus TaxID=2527691 RepID=A0A515ER31_9BURK|nr:hemerythrin domain-containing protein [Rhodoferax aquaticus]QDL55124.1 hemerythrin [Rhodoferax aquaticus]
MPQPNPANTHHAIMVWSDALSLNLPLMDDVHHEFIDLLAVVAQAPDAELVTAWSTLIDHTEAHFAGEDRWMEQTGFSSSNCHSSQHKVILQIMREGLQRGRQGELDVVRQMAFELGMWFAHHAQSMDAALALHLRNVGFDPATGRIAQPQALPMQAIHGCGGDSCSDTQPPARSRTQADAELLAEPA